MALPPASFVYLDPKSHQLGFVYEKKSPGELKEVGAALEGFSGVVCQSPVARPEGDSVIFIAVKKSVDLKATTRKLKELLQPQLPMTVYLLKLGVKRCRQDVHNGTSALPAFIAGFGPASMHEFLNRLYVQSLKIRMRELFPIDESTETHLLYVNAMTSILRRQGAFVQSSCLEVSFCC